MFATAMPMSLVNTQSLEHCKQLKDLLLCTLPHAAMEVSLLLAKHNFPMAYCLCCSVYRWLLMLTSVNMAEQL